MWPAATFSRFCFWSILQNSNIIVSGIKVWKMASFKLKRKRQANVNQSIIYLFRTCFVSFATLLNGSFHFWHLVYIIAASRICRVNNSSTCRRQNVDVIHICLFILFSRRRNLISWYRYCSFTFCYSLFSIPSLCKSNDEL